MGKENKSRFAILGMLTLCPMSGYDIKKAIEQSIGNFWSESYGQVYPLLKQLNEEGLTVSQAQKQAGKPERIMYTLTEEGFEQLQHWLAEPIENQVGRNELLLKLFFGRQISPNLNMEHLRRFRALQEHNLRRYQQIETHLQDDTWQNAYSRITLSYGRHECEALMAWCDETLALLQRLSVAPPKEDAEFCELPIEDSNSGDSDS